MASTSSSNPNPNPNPNLNTIKPSSSTKFPKSKRKNRKPRNKNKNKNKTPNWLELPEDIWSLIFSKLYTIHLIENVQKVCMLFRKICKQPSLYKVVNMTLPDAFMELTYNANIMTRHIIDRSCGGLIDIYLEYVCDDDTFMYIVERSKNLKHLRLGHYLYVSDEALVDAVKLLPELEELEIIICSFSSEIIEDIGHACPSLKSFSWNEVGSKRYKEIYDEGEEDLYNLVALGIAKSMPNLRKLQLIGDTMNNKGLKAILDGCPRLESLDLRTCFYVDLSGDLGERCGKIKQLRLPNDSTADYSHQAYTDSEQFRTTKLGSPSLSDYDDDDDDDFYGIYPDIVDYLDIEDFGDEFIDYESLNDAFDYFPACFFAGGSHFDYDSSD